MDALAGLSEERQELFRLRVERRREDLESGLAGVYSARPTPSATVSTPMRWSELREGAVPRDFTLVTVPMRLSQRADPWSRAELDGARADLLAWREGVIGVRRAS